MVSSNGIGNQLGSELVLRFAGLHELLHNRGAGGRMVDPNQSVRWNLCRAIGLWAYLRGITLGFSRPANGQRLHRSIQWSFSRRMSEHSLVPEPCRC